MPINKEYVPIDNQPTIKPRTVTGIFTRYIAKTLPLAFDESMSYYECLCALLEYINTKVIPALDNNAAGLLELQEFYEELQTYVNDYFKNLDVQEEINNKLDDMAESGQLTDIIAQYLGLAGMIAYDTVADMKLAENLVNGSKCHTLGYRAVNDGGDAIYKVRTITNDDVVDDKFIIELHDDTLIAELICDEVNVKQIGAYGDNTHDDTLTITAGSTFALANNKVLYFPKGTYSVTSLNLKSLIIKCEGIINNSQNVVLGGNSNSSTTTDVNIYKINNITIEGAKNSNFNIIYAGTITLSCDGNESLNTSIAYNRYTGITCTGITLTGANNGWINENVFNIKRCEGDLTITGDGTYPHNNNHFLNMCIEGSTRHITITYGHNNYISYRGEGSPIITLGDDVTKCFANIIEREETSNAGSIISAVDFNVNSSFNSIGGKWLPTFKCEKILDVNKYNAKHINGNIFINDQNKIYASWNYLFQTEKTDATFPFIAYIKSNAPSIILILTCYDENDNKIPGKVWMPGVTYNTTNGNYASTTTDRAMITFYPSTEVKKITLEVRCGGGVTFDEVVGYIYTPFTNTPRLVNSVNTNKKYMTSIPSNTTVGNPTWEVGDIVYATTPTTVLGWVCTTAGTSSNSVWKGIPIS